MLWNIYLAHALISIFTLILYFVGVLEKQLSSHVMFVFFCMTPGINVILLLLLLKVFIFGR